MALHGGFIPYSGTFLTFSDYARNALRMAALMQIQNIFVYTHDSIGLGEDGPTHQPVEHTASLRLMPNMRVWRPCDTVETAVAWRDAIERSDGPHQPGADAPGSAASAARRRARWRRLRRGGYTLRESDGTPELIILIATGSEVALAMRPRQRHCAADGVAVRVVSMPCTDLFDAQDAAYREQVLPASSYGARRDRSRRHAMVGGATSGPRARYRSRSALASRRRPTSCSNILAFRRTNVVARVCQHELI